MQAIFAVLYFVCLLQTMTRRIGDAGQNLEIAIDAKEWLTQTGETSEACAKLCDNSVPSTAEEASTNGGTHESLLESGNLSLRSADDMQEAPLCGRKGMLCNSTIATLLFIACVAQVRKTAWRKSAWRAKRRTSTVLAMLSYLPGWCVKDHTRIAFEVMVTLLATRHHCQFQASVPPYLVFGVKGDYIGVGALAVPFPANFDLNRGRC